MPTIANNVYSNVCGEGEETYRLSKQSKNID